MSSDPFLPFFVCEASHGECYVVHARRVGVFVEVSLILARGGSDAYMPIEELAFKRFPHVHTSEYVEYASHLEDAAKYAARGELGYGVNVSADAKGVRVCVVARLLSDDGQLQTEILHEHYFEDPDSHAALVAANEKATELRTIARELNDDWASRRRARLLELRNEYERADVLAEAAEGLRSIIDAEEE